MNLSNEQEQIARLKKSNERLTIFCIVFAAIAIGAGLYGRIQHSMANEQRLLANINAERAMDASKKAQLLAEEVIRQRTIAERMAAELTLAKQKSKKTK